MADPMIEAVAVTKVYGEVTALDGVTVRVSEGTVAGLLGHNGAGKTTLVNVLTTMVPPSGGTARVAGLDVVADAHKVRGRIGLTGQFASVDDQLTGLDNLVTVARLLGAGRRAAHVRAGELIDLFGLGEAATRPARTYSGGMRRRLDLATSLVGQPDVLFLDEPTTGLDPVARLGVWEIVEALVHDGTTVLLTTQYLEEADRLAGSIAVLSAGRVVASGTPAELKAGVGRRSVHITLADAPEAVAALERAGLAAAYDEKNGGISAQLPDSRQLALVVRALEEFDIGELTLTEPTLDDVYLALSRNTPSRNTLSRNAGSRNR
ncbi:ATP-binding cassette domain-containing protein [Sinosporangium siamense]|uniref:Daunorubicin ABC transporter ATPase n=1 Tax=Sinosporangium siamense TaxID=1367973 RepID=A0A919RJ91_9ACTN|nr:ATP-binding cassette domain-containing protein [Sinosporangium siamense]GII92904.1 daunorubicin ABC transporter ATPase [Sinosporangium siamense]